MKIVLAVSLAAALALALTFRYENDSRAAGPGPSSPIQLGAPLGPPHLSAAQAESAARAPTDGTLFTYAKAITVDFGSYNLGFYRKREVNGRPAIPTELLTPAKDYWTVTLSGLDKDSAGNYLLQPHGGTSWSIHPDHNITFIVDDATGQVVQSTEWG